MPNFIIVNHTASLNNYKDWNDVADFKRKNKICGNYEIYSRKEKLASCRERILHIALAIFSLGFSLLSKKNKQIVFKGKQFVEFARAVKIPLKTLPFKASNQAASDVNHVSNKQQKSDASFTSPGIKRSSTRPANKVEGQETESVQYNDLITKSTAFAQKVATFPTEHNLIAAVVKDNPVKMKEVLEHAKATKAIIHPRTAALVDDFLAFKRVKGSAVEQQLYAKMSRKNFLKRLLTHRPMAFLTAADTYQLRDGTKGNGGFETIGTAAEKAPLQLKDYLSYDEMQISALLGVSVPTHFINNGNRNNRGEKGKVGEFEQKGVYTGLVGARFEKENKMEWPHMVVTAEQNIPENGYGIKSAADNPLGIWAKFYGETHFPTYAEAIADKSGRYLAIGAGRFLDTKIYKKRMRAVIEPFLIDADQRGGAAGKRAYVHAVGLGLGVWQIHPDQAKYLIEVYKEILSESQFKNIADIDFSYIMADKDKAPVGMKDSSVVHDKGNDIRIHFSQRNPADKLVGVDAGKLLVAQYAWDGNSFAGNEYWLGQLSASGDPAAACCSTIPELQNPFINPYLLKNLES